MSKQDVVEVVYATPDIQRIVELPRSDGMTAGEAVERSRLLEEFPEIRQEPLVLGRFGERVDAGCVLASADRIEICRPLIRDPRTLRRELLSQGQVMGSTRRREGSESSED